MLQFLLTQIGKLKAAVSSLNGNIASIGIQSHGRGTVEWGSSAEIVRPENKSMLVFGGRSGIAFMFYVPQNTTEDAPIKTDGISNVSITQTKVTITAASSGYGSTLNYEYIVFE